jgi:Uma2 family endonuclease
LGSVYLEHHPYRNNIFWLIEFSNSSLTKDLEQKSKVYATENIQEYWVVNLQNQTLIVFRSPQQGDYQSQEILTQGDIYPLAFPDMVVSVQRLLVV